MISNRDGHVRVLPLHVANKIAAGEVVERPASVVKELVENAIDAGAKRIAITITQGGRKLVSVRDDGIGMSKEDALLSLERQATSKIRDVSDIEEIDTLGFRGEAIPSIASVSRFSITTRTADADDGTFIQVNAGTIAEVRSAGCPVGTLVEVRDLFCNVPARRKFLRAYTTEENHIRQVFTVHALAHPAIGFSLNVDGRELYRLAPATSIIDRVRELFGDEFLEKSLTIKPEENPTSTIEVSGLIERPNLSAPTRRDQYIFVNGRPASASSITYALREAYPHRVGEVRPAAIIFINLNPNQVDVNVHPTKREVRFRDNAAVKNAIIKAIENAIQSPPSVETSPALPITRSAPIESAPIENLPPANVPVSEPIAAEISPQPVPLEFAIEPESEKSKPWRWFKFLAQSESGYLLIETDAGIVTINPHAARERIAYEKLLANSAADPTKRAAQTLLIPETVQLSPVESARIKASIPVIATMGFQIEEFGRDTFKIEATPQLIGSASPSAILSSIANDLAEGASKRGSERWREELIAKSIAKSFAGAALTLNADSATKLVEELCSCKMPYVCPRGKPVMIFTSTRELDRKFAKD